MLSPHLQCVRRDMLKQSFRLRRLNAQHLFLPTYVMIAAFAPLFADEYRLWRDNTGEFSVNAKLVSQDRTSVELQTEAGKILRVPISRLSAADREHLVGTSTSRPELPTWNSVLAPENLPAPSVLQKQRQLALKGPVAEIQDGETLGGYLSKLPFPIYLDEHIAYSAGVTKVTQIDSPARGKTLADQIDAVLQPLNLTWQEHQTLVVVKDLQWRSSLYETVVYPLGKLDAGQAIQLLSGLEPQTWESKGGTGAIGVVEKRIVVWQSVPIHRLIQSQLKLQPIPRPYLHPLDKRTIAISCRRTPLSEFASVLESRLGQPVQIDDAALIAIGLSKDVKITLDLPGCSAKDVLDAVLGIISCTWLEKDKAIVITTSEAASELLETHQLEMQAYGIPASSRSLLMQVVQQTVAPDDWAVLGGPSRMTESGNSAISVTASQPILRELNGVMAALRQN